MSAAAEPSTVETTPRVFFDWANRPTVPDDIPEFQDWCKESTLHEPNITHFLPEEAPSHVRKHFEKLDLHNRDAYVCREDTLVWKKVDHEYHKDLIKGMVHQLELSKKQSEFACQLYDVVDRQKIGRWSELTAFCCCVLALEVYKGVRVYHPSRNDENNDVVFLRIADWLCQRFTIDEWSILSVLNKIREKWL